MRGVREPGIELENRQYQPLLLGDAKLLYEGTSWKKGHTEKEEIQQDETKRKKKMKERARERQRPTKLFSLVKVSIFLDGSSVLLDILLTPFHTFTFTLLLSASISRISRDQYLKSHFRAPRYWFFSFDLNIISTSMDARKRYVPGSGSIYLAKPFTAKDALL